MRRSSKVSMSVEMSLRYSHQFGVICRWRARKKKTSSACKVSILAVGYQALTGNMAKSCRVLMSAFSDLLACVTNHCCNRRYEMEMFCAVPEESVGMCSCGQLSNSRLLRSNCHAKRRSPSQLWNTAARGCRVGIVQTRTKLGRKGIWSSCTLMPISVSAKTAVRPADGKQPSLLQSQFEVVNSLSCSCPQSSVDRQRLLTTKGWAFAIKPTNFRLLIRISPSRNGRLAGWLNATKGTFSSRGGRTPEPLPTTYKCELLNTVRYAL